MTDTQSPSELLREARGYVEGNHDEGCELDLEFGESNFERANDEVMDNSSEDSRDWPDDAVCTCGTDEILAAIDAYLASQKEAKPATGEADALLLEARKLLQEADNRCTPQEDEKDDAPQLCVNARKASARISMAIARIDAHLTQQAKSADTERDALVETIRTAIATAKARWTAGDQYEQSLVSQHYGMPSVKHMAEHVAAALKEKTNER